MKLTLGEIQHAEPRRRPGELMRGRYWSITRDGTDYLLCFLSADLGGRENRLVIKETEVRAIIAGNSSVVHFLPPPA